MLNNSICGSTFLPVGTETSSFMTTNLLTLMTSICTVPLMPLLLLALGGFTRHGLQQNSSWTWKMNSSLLPLLSYRSTSTLAGCYYVGPLMVPQVPIHHTFHMYMEIHYTAIARVPGHSNNIFDSLTRFSFQKFRSLAPHVWFPLYSALAFNLLILH